jgi:hypothetical protein
VLNTLSLRQAAVEEAAVLVSMVVQVAAVLAV